MIEPETTRTNKGQRLEKVSTDAALASSVVFALLAQFAAPDVLVLREMLLPFQELQDSLGSPANIDPTSEEAKKMWGRAKPVFAKMLTSSCDAAAESLARVVTLDRILRKLDARNPNHIVAILYCIARLLKDNNRFAEVQKDAEDLVGKNWLWPIVWEIALSCETVKRRWDREEQRGACYLDDWRDECQKFANNYWSAKKKEFGRIELLKDRMIFSLRKRLGLV